MGLISMRRGGTITIQERMGPDGSRLSACNCAIATCSLLRPSPAAWCQYRVPGTGQCVPDASWAFDRRCVLHKNYKTQKLCWSGDAGYYLRKTRSSTPMTAERLETRPRQRLGGAPHRMPVCTMQTPALFRKVGLPRWPPCPWICRCIVGIRASDRDFLRGGA